MTEVADVPPGVGTVISTVPAAPAGEIAVIEVSLFTVNEVAGVAPNLTPVAPVKPDPVIAIEVPAANGPAVGKMPVTAGGFTVMYKVLISSSEPNAFVAVRLIS